MAIDIFAGLLYSIGGVASAGGLYDMNSSLSLRARGHQSSDHSRLSTEQAQVGGASNHVPQIYAEYKILSHLS